METTYRPEAQCPLVNVHNKQYIYIYIAVFTQTYKNTKLTCASPQMIDQSLEIVSFHQEEMIKTENFHKIFVMT